MDRSIDVVIPAFNAERYLERAVASVFGLGRVGVRAIIVDDGSTDGTATIAQRFADREPDRCRLLRSDRNCGVSVARNLGIEAATATWVAFLDADDYFLPNRLDAFDALPDSDLEQLDGLYQSTRILAAAASDLEGANGDASTFGIQRPLTGVALLAELLTGYCWATSGIVVRRSLLKRCGGFDPARKIAEDCHLWFRLASFAALRAGSLDAPVSVYWRHEQNTFTPRIEHRVPMLDAMLDAWGFAQRQRAAPPVLQTFAAAVPAYALRSIVAAREAHAPAIARRLLLMLARSRPRAALRTPFLRQAWALLRAHQPVAAGAR